MYLDDGLGGASDLVSSKRASDYIRKSLSDFGFLIAEDKCIWYPQQNLIWIGLVWDMYLGKIQITQERVDRLLLSIVKILDGVSKGKILYRAKLVACIVGQIISMQVVFGSLVRLRTRELYQCIVLRASWKSLVALTAPAVGELRFWSNSVNDLNEMGVNLHESDLYDLKAYTDASDIGFGGFVVPAIDSNSAESVCDSSDVQMNSSLITPRNSLHTVVGSWADHESIKSSTWRELEAVNRTVKSSLHLLKNQRHYKLIQIIKNVTSIVKNGSRKTDLQVLACELHTLCFENSCKITTQWIPRDQNKVADNLSRYSDCDDWGISTDVFNSLDNIWGIHTVDRFATDYNTKCTRFNSKFWCNCTEAVDAFKQNWKGENNWVVPPPNLVCKVIRKFLEDEANGTLVVPFWKSAPYWVLLCESNGNFKRFINNKKFLTEENSVITGRGLNIEQFVHEAVEDSGIEEGHSLHNLVRSLSTRLLDARSESTDKKYYYGFMKWKRFCIEHSLLSLPASPIHIALYFVHLLDNGGTFSTVNTAFYSVKWAHEICGQLDPTSNTFVQNLLESAKRTAKNPVNKKDPVSKDILIDLCSMYQYSNDLTVVRDLVMILLSFSAFLRFSELSQLKCNDVTIKEGYLVLKIRKSKTDQYRAGDEVLVSRGSL
ncbi:Hypothetical predicted protein [Mytilus galloprovincialis]|uniref:Reverse transcriptase domain-containing protein n=1 Tax=Mytilus galloprovincialis TaxID=29158 RepID=A0A8B6GUD0_MYTGA|nr:Hypothetical predicted protein [Mytilus galloprovincialis]